MLNKLDQNWLLEYAHQHIVATLGQEASISQDIPEMCSKQAGCFVTITKKPDKALRGCIGTFNFERALYLNIGEMAQAAATRDPRFPPLGAAELETIELEISVLSPPELCTPEQITIGVHGLIVERDFSKGVLLPQVAPEYDWSVEQFLEHTCLKARLSKDAWREPETQISAFTAQVFSERA
ncbi:MAG: AmmeMemoRadiSam system protein A [Myxococcota bacterium]|jgi:hypothetical protein|nr:AmmeMemoRadiSam system protein A [Myxococcota bacterium]